MDISKNFTIVIPCIYYEDVKDSLKKIRNIYSSIKIIVCLNNKIKFQNKDRNTLFIYSDSRSIGKKRNIAVMAAKTKYIAFIDSDAYPKKKWIENSIKYLKYSDVGIVSGPNINPLKQNFIENIIGTLKKSYLVSMKPELQRGYEKKAQYIKFLPSVNWILEKKIFLKNKLMNTKMIRNEDWDFVHRLKNLNLRVFYSPNSIVYHKNGSLDHFIKKRFKYGFYMKDVLNKNNSENYYFYIPLLFCIFLFSFPLVFIFKIYLIFYLTTLLIFFSVIIFETLRVSKKIKFIPFVFIFLIPSILSPGFGIIFSILNKKK